jgi:predicted RNase H-like nuclease (RuvC/YqgF family)
MATQTISSRSCLLVTVVVLTANVAGLSGGRGAHGQEGAKGSSPTIEEIRGRIAHLKAQVERQQSQLQVLEASLSRLQAIQAELKASIESHPQNRVHSLDERRSLRDQAIADKMEWTWSDERATLNSSVREIADGYGVQLDPSKETPGYSLITLTRAGTKVYSWDGHAHSVFVVSGDVLYYADFPGVGPGCTVIAHDLKGGKLR